MSPLQPDGRDTGSGIHRMYHDTGPVTIHVIHRR
jgi:hypothetical protein